MDASGDGAINLQEFSKLVQQLDGIGKSCDSCDGIETGRSWKPVCPPWFKPARGKVAVREPAWRMLVEC